MKISEGKIEIDVPKIQLDKKAKVFFNPVMQLNRDISVLLLSARPKKRVLDLLAASGIRGLRIAKEVPGTEVTLNDYKTAKNMAKNARLNKLKVKIEDNASNVLLARQEGYDYIDIDPFGTPVPFLDAAIKRLSPHGILAVTATDTSLLCGTYPKACKRVYGSRPLRNEFCKEIGLRILIKKVQQVAGQYEVALEPIFSHSSNHYMRVYLQKEVGASKADKILENQGYLTYCWACTWRKSSKTLLQTPKKCPKCRKPLDFIGKIWLGPLWDSKLVENMLKLAISRPEIGKQARKLLEIVQKEAKIGSVGFYDLHILAKKGKWKSVPKFDTYLKKVKGVKSHFADLGFKLSE